MVKKVQKSSAAAAKQSAALGGSVKDSAQQIWSAGLSAFSKAQQEGGKMFESMVKEGLTIQRKTQAGVEEKITEATSKMAHMASGISTKATGQWDKLENIFEDRVAKALNKLGVPSAKDIDALVARIDALNKTVQKSSAKTAVAATKTASTAVTQVVAKTAKTAKAVVKTARKVAAKAV